MMLAYFHPGKLAVRAPRWAAAAVLACLPALAQGGEAAEFFETKIRPLLADRCFACHTSARLGGLEMTSRDALLKGGNSGPAIDPGKPASSLLLQAVRHTHDRLKMPPEGKLAGEQIADLARWISDGAVWPQTPAAAGPSGADEFVIGPEERNFWAFQPVEKPAPPEVRDKAWPRGPIDRFILARLEEKGLQPVAAADKRTLLRRAYFDLIGLPPSPEQVDAFAGDRSPAAFEKVVDRLLASPRYGERWGRHWLDVARYSDDKLNSTQMEPYPHAYRYRDWVIRAFNDDMPFDRFIKAQIAGDLISGGGDAELIAGLGFYALSPQFQDDRIDATMRGFQAMTVACAQCHDHKFDPIPTEDFYALLGIFNSTKIDEFPLASPEIVEDYEGKRKDLEKAEKVLGDFLRNQGRQLSSVLAGRTASYLFAAWEVLGPRGRRAEDAAGDHLLDRETLERWVRYLESAPREHPLLDGFEALLTGETSLAGVRRWGREMEELVVSVLEEKKKVDAENNVRLGGEAGSAKRNEVELLSLERDRYFLWRDIGSDKGFKTPAEFSSGILYYRGGEIDRFLSLVWQDHAERLRTKVKQARARLPEKYPFLHVIGDKAQPRNERVHIRGSKNNLGAEVPRGFLTILGGGEPITGGSGRLELAEAIANPDNPLTARVTANRIWLHHFGAGIVNTPSNFGRMGERPSHPKLLDYLAARFVEANWSVKAMHREIMLSATYALGNKPVAGNLEVDPSNRLLWRANRRRLDAEAIRDFLLAVSGNLDLSSGGEPVPLSDPANRRRTVYSYISRRKLDKMLGLFDFPNPNKTSPRRIGTNTALQGLFFLNSEFMMRQAERLSDRLEQEFGAAGSQKEKVAYLYRLLFGRRPAGAEMKLARRFLNGDSEAWPRFTQVLMSSNEFLYIP